MALSFTLRSEPFEPLPEKPVVLVTGAAGTIGSYFAEHAKGRYDLRLLVRHENDRSEALNCCGEVIVGDIADPALLARALKGVHVVLHLAGDPSPNATWESLLPSNIVGTYNILLAAKSAGVRRVILASSIHAVSGYRADVQVKTTDPVNPGDLYGVSKCFGEALGRYVAEQEDLSVIALRIAAFQPREEAAKADKLWMFDAWVSRRDLQQLFCLCIEDTKLQFALFHGLSDNRFKRLDITDAKELLGYAPQDDFTEVNPLVKPLKLDEKVWAHSRADASEEPGMRDDLAKLTKRS